MIDCSVSCLMVTRRPTLALLAAQTYQRQTHADRELVVVDNSTDGEIGGSLSGLLDTTIRVLRVPPGPSLGTLRNIAMSNARGRYVCTWDDDDIYDPQRLELQVEALAHSGSALCLLARQLQWWPRQHRLAVSLVRAWENTLVCERSVMPRFPDLRRGSDKPVVRALVAGQRTVWLHRPWVYVRVQHGDNIWDAAHFEAFWNGAQRRLIGEAYLAAVRNLACRLPIIAYQKTLGLSPYDSREVQRAQLQAQRNFARVELAQREWTVTDPLDVSRALGRTQFDMVLARLLIGVLPTTGALAPVPAALGHAKWVSRR
jgi:glycosyltransferase involved in cell wall biosynthesis